jgi:uncharacterized protein (DUF1697 family)
MSKYVAFLRAINVGGHTVKMDQLRRLFEGTGFANVETFIASGNVIFDSPAKNTKSLESKIQNSLQGSLGYPVATFIRSIPEVVKIAAYDVAQEGSLYVAFLPGSASIDSTKKLLSLSNEIDAFEVRGREVYWHCRTRFSESAFSGALLEKTLSMPATLRNITTVRKIATKYSV